MKNNKLTLQDLKLYFDLQALFTREDLVTLYNLFVVYDGLSIDKQYYLLSKDFPDLYNKLNNWWSLDEE